MTEKEFNIQIGRLAGELIVSRYLPTLSTDQLQTHRVIQVSEDLTDQWNEMEEKRYVLMKISKKKYTKYFYESLEWYRKNIEDKYLPKTIKCHLYLSYTDKDIVMEQIEMCLWDSDLSHYKIEDIDDRGDVILKIDRK